MILEQHYDDEVLIGFLGDEPAARRDPHLSHCRPCAETLHTLRSMSDVLVEEAVWDDRELDETPRVETMEFLRAKQREVGAETAEAAPRLKELLAQPRESWAATIQAHPEWRTAGMVRAMVGEHSTLIRKSPVDAVELMTLAAEMADLLPQHDVAVRVHARRELAYAFYFQGKLEQAETQLDLAERLSGRLAAGDYDVARQRVIRSLIARGKDDGDAAIAFSRAAASTFITYQDLLRYQMAESARAAMLLRAGRAREAIDVWSAIEPFVKDDATRYGILQNIGVAYAHLGEVDKASEYLHRIATFVAYSGAATESARVRLTIAGILTQKGRYTDALETLRRAEAEFVRLGMSEEVIVAQLSQAELYLVLGQSSDAATVSRNAYEHLKSVGLERTKRALTAISFLAEAAERGRATPHTARRVRRRVQSVGLEALLHAPE